MSYSGNRADLWYIVSYLSLDDSDRPQRVVVQIGKGKGHPRSGHEGPEGECMSIFTVSLTLALDVNW